MKSPFPMILLIFFPLVSALWAAEEGGRVYELRTYHASPGKMDALKDRFRDHTTKLFEKHGMTNVGYWTPVEPSGNRLVYLMSYPSRMEREAMWKAFLADPDWIAAKGKSEVEGKLVDRVESLFLVPTEYSPALKLEARNPPRQFELRTYTANDGKLPELHARFRDHTMAIFARHGMENIVYLQPDKDQPGSANTLIYLLAHRNDEARRESFAAFGKDPEWQAARKASEESGPLLMKGGVVSMPLIPTEFSPLK